MAGTALAVIDRLMLGERALLTCDRIFMTAVADLLHRSFHQARLGGGMR